MSLLHQVRSLLRWPLLWGVLALATATSIAEAELIVNGSFEEGDFGGFESFRRLTPGSTALVGWTIGGVAVDWHNSVEFRFPRQGDKVIDLHLDGGFGQHGSISQSFATVRGRLYELSFYLAGPGSSFGFPNPRSVLVEIAGTQQYFSSPASLHTDLQWFRHVLRFTAVDTATTLKFLSPHLGRGFWGPVLDDVSVVRVRTAAVPEPASPVLLLGGIGSMAVLARWRSRRVLGPRVLRPTTERDPCRVSRTTPSGKIRTPMPEKKIGVREKKIGVSLL
jgi:choice-of-anchor C domain-containing protein